MSGRWRVRAIGLVLFVVTLATALVAQEDVGIARDEVVYMGAGDGYAQWWLDVAHGKRGATSEKGITAAWAAPAPPITTASTRRS